MNCLIVEDLEAPRVNLTRIIETYCSELNVVGVAVTIGEAQKALQLLKPDLVFLDIELGNENSFDLLESLESIDFDIIFTTAHNDFALRAFKFSAVDYLLKPVDPEELLNALERIKARRESPKNKESLNALLRSASKGVVEQIQIANGGDYLFVDIKDIVRCEAQDNYTSIILNNRKPILSSKNIKEYEGLLEASNFFRVHKKHLVNISFVEKYSKGINSNVSLKNGDSVDIARRRMDDFLRFVSAV